MPILQAKPTAPPVQDPVKVEVAEPRYQSRTPIVDTRYTPSASILAFVEGSAWATNYYSQVLGEESEPAPLNPALAPAYQQYCRVEGMELKVTQSLTSTTNPQTSATTVIGAATTSPRFIPNKHDMFLADMGDGRMGMFTVTAVEKRSYHKDTLYQIEYQLVDYADSQTGRDTVADMDAKVVKTGIYQKDFLHLGQNPVVLSQDFDYLIKFQDFFERLLTHWFKDFYSHEFNTLMIPDQLQPSYDPFLARRVLDWISTQEHPYVTRIKHPRVSGVAAMNQTTVWDAIAQMDQHLLPMCMHQAKLVSTIHFRNRPQLTGLYFTGISRVLYPLDTRTDVDSVADCEVPLDDAEALQEGKPRTANADRSPQDIDASASYIATPPALPDVVRVGADDYYVFSENFYHGTAPYSSNLEKLVRDALEEEPVDKAVLVRLCENALQWSNLERFYYIPALLAVLKVALRTN